MKKKATIALILLSAIATISILILLINSQNIIISENRKDPYFDKLEQYEINEQSNKDYVIVKNTHIAVKIAKISIASVFDDNPDLYIYHVFYDNSSSTYYVKASGLFTEKYIIIGKNDGDVQLVIETKF